MFETMYLKLRNTYRKIDMKIRKKRYRFNDKLPKDIKYFEGSLYDAVYEASFKWPYNTALEYFNTQITYKELIKKINKVAFALKALGVQKKDIVTICMPNTPEAVYMFYAISEIGAVANMIHPLSSEKEIEYYLNNTKSKVMLCIDVTYSKVKAIMDNTSLERVIISSATKSTEKLTAFLYWVTKGRKIKVVENEKVMLWNHFLLNSTKYIGNPHVRVDNNDDAVILYSGGTTGNPKGVVLTNLNFNALALNAKYTSDLLNSENAFLTFLPNFHAFGIGICTHIPLYFGMRVVLIPQFNAKKIKHYIRKYRFNILCGVPTLYEYISKLSFRKNELKCIKMAVSGGDAMSDQLKEKVENTFKKYGADISVQIGYGLTESCGVVAFSPLGVKDANIIGYAIPNCDFLIKDLDSNKESMIGDDGEILVYGPTVMKGYYNNEEETKNSFITLNGKKWLRTGDIGYFDRNGFLHYKTRLKRLIITSGYNVYPSHVESVIMDSNLVQKCAVVGMPHEVKGEMVKAFVVFKPECDNFQGKSQLNKHLKEHLAKYEQPKEIRFVEDLPLTKMNKIDFMALKKMN